MSAVIRQSGERVGIFTLLARAEGRNCHVRCACGRESVKDRSNAKRLRRCGPECPLPTLYTTHGKRPVTRHIGQRFGRLVVLAIIKSGTDASARVACDCGEVLAVLVSNIASGATTSCGCANRNTRRTVFILVDGARVPAISVYEKHGISHQLFGRRIGLGWDPLKAATLPPAGPTTKAAIALRKAAA